jgi:hypothetical protein
MIGHALAANAVLLKNFPKGFPFDTTHHPNVSIFAGFVPTADLRIDLRSDPDSLPAQPNFSFCFSI